MTPHNTAVGGQSRRTIDNDDVSDRSNHSSDSDGTDGYTQYKHQT
jgi:hypothetical protein